MENKASSFEAIMAVLPAVQEEVRAEIAKRIAAGETIAYAEYDQITASLPITRDLAARRRELMEEFSGKASVVPKAKTAA